MCDEKLTVKYQKIRAQGDRRSRREESRENMLSNW